MMRRVINPVSLDLKPWQALVTLGMMYGSVYFVPPYLKPRDTLITFWVIDRCIDFVPFDFEPGQSMISIWVMNCCINPTHVIPTLTPHNTFSVREIK